MHEPLIDNEGYPRNDIDVHKVREGRNRLICLGNDLKAITLKIEMGLHNLHSQSAQSVPKSQASEAVSLAEDNEKMKPFANIDSVDPNSPADLAGIKIGDQMVSFGSVTYKNLKGDLRNVANVAQSSQNQNVRVQVLRNGKVVTLSLKPQAWAGRGLIGCHIIPIKNNEESIDR